MKIKEEYILREIDDRWVVIDIDFKSVNFNKILSLNDTGKFLWELLEQEISQSELVSALMKEFDIDYNKSVQDVKLFVDELNNIGCLE